MAAEDLGLSGWKEGCFAQVRRDGACDGIFDKDLNNTTDVGREEEGQGDMCGTVSAILFTASESKTEMTTQLKALSNPITPQLQTCRCSKCNLSKSREAYTNMMPACCQTAQTAM